MLDFNYIKEQFIKKHITIDDNEYLYKYINFLLNYELKNENEYTEKHHILPSSTFHEFKNEQWNLIRISYEDHRLVHLWLYKAINIRAYQNPLRFMMSYYKNSKELSIAAKRGWVNLKNNEEKYTKWRLNKSEYMKTLSSDERSRRANIFWKNMTDEKYIEFCNSAKKCWTEDRKNKKSEEMLFYYLNEENRKKKSIETKTRWDNMPDEDKIIFDKKMNIVNKDINKRKDAGEKIKSLWLNEEYLEKMKKRKKRSGLQFKLINTDSTEIIFKSMQEIINQYNFSAYLIRKYRDTNIKIKIEDLTDKNKQLLNCLIETIK